jgi:hypothetical protein
MFPILLAKCQGGTNPAQQGFFAEWLVQEAYRPCRKRTRSDSRVATSGHENQWNVRTRFHQAALHLESTHSRHVKVENNTAHSVRISAQKELFPRAKGLDDKTKRRYQAADCPADRIIIVDDRKHSWGRQLASIAQLRAYLWPSYQTAGFSKEPPYLGKENLY